jgi:malyl-CoA/(S)-citramalyl-CoA lyase
MYESTKPTLPIQRSELAVPASSIRFMEKAAVCEADSIFLDLEDAVIPELKAKARAQAIQAINELDWGTKVVSVRVNGLDTQWGCRDIVDIAQACPRLDRIVLPKCDTVAHVHTLELMLGSIELGLDRAEPIGIEALIETARGMANVEAIAATGTRLKALVFGGGDYQLDMRIFNRSVGAPSANYAVLTDADGQGERARHWNDPWHFALARVANACHANGLVPLDGPFTNIGDPDGFRAAALRAAALGFQGKWAIHPSQIEASNEIFAPTADQVAWAEHVLGAMAEAGKQGRGAVKDKHGDMIDIAHIKMARAIQARARRIPRGAAL